MSVEARLQALVQNYRAQHGDAGLYASTQLIAQLSSQAPDLYGEIRALSAAITGNAVARIAASPDQDGEAQRVATEIAGTEKLSMAVAIAGVAVARALGPVGGPAAPAMPPPPPAAAGGWAGETVVAGPAPAPGYPPAAGYVPPGSVPPPGQSAAVPIYKNKVAIGVAAAVVLLLGYAYTQRAPSRPQPGPVTNEQGPLAGGPQGGGAPQGGPGPQGGGAPGGGQQGASGQYPMLSRSGTLPGLQVNRMQNGYAIPFLIETQSGPAPGGVIVPLNGWDQGPTTIVFGQPGDTTGQGQIVNQGSVQMQRVEGPNGPARAGQVQWQQDALNMGPICVAFQAPAQTQSGDVGLSGTTMCVMDANCQQSAGCGQVR
ncbi:hypothetical protein [Sphingosinicella sp.]|uniref:hypothetical protein n=1 Tax=Sphingosinicella sp. TaxID=1917971 RepID=UPI0040383E17